MKTILSALLLLASCHAFAFEEADWTAEEQAYLSEADLNEDPALLEQYGDEAPVVLVQGYNMNPKFNIHNSQGGVAPDNTGWSPCTRKQFSFVQVAGWTPVARGWRNPQYRFRQSGSGWLCKKI